MKIIVLSQWRRQSEVTSTPSYDGPMAGGGLQKDGQTTQILEMLRHILKELILRLYQSYQSEERKD